MSEHYQKYIDQAITFCKRCGKQTNHRVSNGRICECLEHEAPAQTKAQQNRRAKIARRDSQQRLF